MLLIDEITLYDSSSFLSLSWCFFFSMHAQTYSWSSKKENYDAYVCMHMIDWEAEQKKKKTVSKYKTTLVHWFPYARSRCFSYQDIQTECEHEKNLFPSEFNVHFTCIAFVFRVIFIVDSIYLQSMKKERFILKSNFFYHYCPSNVKRKVKNLILFYFFVLNMISRWNLKSDFYKPLRNNPSMIKMS